MTNAEKRGQEILAQECRTGNWAVNKDTNEIVECIPTKETCEGNCLFGGVAGCVKGKIEWLNSEYKTKKHFSEADKAVLRVLDKVQWVARNKSGNVIAYWEKPKKTHLDFWDSYMGGINLTEATSAEFSAIQWEDEEPTSRAEILGEEK